MFDGPGWDSTPSPTAVQKDAVSAPIEVEVCPSLNLVSTHFPVRDLSSDVSMADIASRGSTCHHALHRRNFVVQHFEVGDDEIDLLAALKKGLSIPEAILVGTADRNINVERMRRLFADWSAKGVLRTKN